MAHQVAHKINGEDQMPMDKNGRPEVDPDKNPYHPAFQRKNYLDWQVKHELGEKQ